ncbi:MAG: hypothetical protein ABR886_03290 [Dehalococcoidales bacterium]|jgi:hypothetical protein
MSFIRAKEIPPHSGNWYDYEVKTVHEGAKVRQKVIKYLGRSGRVRDKAAIPETKYKVTRHPRKTSKVVDVTLKPI